VHLKFTNVKRKALIGLSALTLASVALAPSAFAEPKSGGGGSRGCPVEDEHGNVSYVPVGTVVGLFHCGSDGEWHFGWLTTDLTTSTGGSSSQFGNTATATQSRAAAP
jgi:hypothetical protein